MINFNKILKLNLKFVNKYSTYYISDIFKTKPISNNVSVKGWIKSIRNMKDKCFIDLSDGSCNSNLQIVVPKNLLSDYDLNTGASIHAQGVLDKTPKGQLEIQASSIKIIGDCIVNDGYPFAPRTSYHPDYTRQYLHFRPRTIKFSSVLRTRNAASLAIHNYLNSEGFVSVSAPILTSNDCEGAGEIFTVCPDSDELLESMNKSKPDKLDVFFDKKVFLSVSGQMHLEAVAHGLGKVYTLGPTFRAENSKSRLHLNEFYMLESEIAFLDDLETLCTHIETLVKNVTKNVLNTNLADVKSVLQGGETIENHFAWLEKPFLVMTYDEACRILNGNIHKFKNTGFNDKSGFGKEHELFLVEYNGNVPIFIINWPKNLKPFYMKSIENEKVAAFDLLVSNVGELVGGSLRENNFDVLKSNIPIQSRTQMEWYLDLRKFGGVPTGGYGLGFERYLQFILNVQNIKDTIPFPRWPHNCAM